MARKKLIWKVYPYYFIIIVVSLIAVAYYASREMRWMYLHEITTNLESKARLVEGQVVGLLVNRNYNELDRLIKELGRASGTRITVVDSTGKVRGDSGEEPVEMENHRHRPEIAQALAGSVGVETRFSSTLQKDMMYVAIPIEREGHIIGALRTALSVSAIQGRLTSLNTKIVIAGVILTVLATMISFVIFRRISQPLKELKEGTDRIAGGELGIKLVVSDTEEIGTLAEAMTNMAAQLDSRIRTITQQRNERMAIFSSMTEGVLALDVRARVISLNQAGGCLLNINPEQVRGKDIHEVVRNTGLLAVVRETLSSSDKVEREIILHQDKEKILYVNGTVLKDANGQKRGIVLVFSDLTHIKRLENIRRDFVANVSHELRTPITAIAGAAETLFDTTVNNPEDIKRLVGIIGRQADRLNNIVADLLTLAHLENDSIKPRLNLRSYKIADVLDSSRLACEHKSKARNIKVEIDCDSQLEAKIIPAKLEQAIINLLNNAIIYSNPGSVVRVRAEAKANEIIISVSDNGCGIDHQHLPRLFERFYRVDKARSREMGGTGLGLAITKHIALAHGGRVSVDSKLGEGSLFRIHIPSQS